MVQQFDTIWLDASSRHGVFEQTSLRVRVSVCVRVHVRMRTYVC